MVKQVKIDAVQKIKQTLTASKGAYLADFQGMTVEQATELRNRCRDAGVEFSVVKNTLALRAVEDESTREALKEYLQGPTAMATSDTDEVAPAKVVLPHGTGKSIRILILAKGPKEKEAEEAGADYVGADYVEKVKGGWLEFDAVVATPDMMAEVGKLGRVLGPRGLMPSPKAGTVTFDVGKAVNELKAGKIEFRVDKGSNVAATVGKASFTPEQLLANATAVIGEIVRNKPSAAKGQYIKSVTLSTTMGPGLALDPTVAMGLAK